MFGGFGMVSGLTVDLRKGGTLPDGLDLVGGEPVFEEQEDGSQALILPEGSYLRLAMPYVSPWSLEDDGRLHSYSLTVALRVSRLPGGGGAAATLPLFHGGAELSADDADDVEHVQLYKNGGVGALGEVGVAEAAVKPGRWTWVAVTRSRDQEVRTYVDGRLCAWIKRE